MTNSHFVFLQGMPSPFFKRIGEVLAENQCTVTRINLCVGDWLFWNGKNTISYRGSFAAWPHFIGDYFDNHGVTDLVLLGEQRRYHKEAVALAQVRGIRVTVNDFGYLRPDWITFERDGMGGDSRFPRDPQILLQRGGSVAKADLTSRYQDSSFNMACADLLYNFSNFFLGVLYQHYRRTDHRPHTLVYTMARAKHLLLTELRKKKNRTEIDAISSSSMRYFVLPLQLDHDFQIVAYSTFDGMGDVIRMVIESFSRFADTDFCLVIKVHPLDTGLVDWRQITKAVADEFSVADRVVYIDGGNLDALTQHAQGMVTVNSTSGLRALQLGCPVKVLGQAVYDVPGLTFQSKLDNFWGSTGLPDVQLLNSFINLMVDSIQIKGVFFSEPGCTDAANIAAQKLLLQSH